jgi:hypothetical protein
VKVICSKGTGWLQTDNFNAASLNTSLWTITNGSNSTGIAQSSSNLEIPMTNNAVHNLYGTDVSAPGVVQTVNIPADTDFSIEAELSNYAPNTTGKTGAWTQAIYLEGDPSSGTPIKWMRFSADKFGNLDTVTLYAYLRFNNTDYTGLIPTGATLTAADQFPLKVKVERKKYADSTTCASGPANIWYMSYWNRKATPPAWVVDRSSCALSGFNTSFNTYAIKNVTGIGLLGANSTVSVPSPFTIKFNYVTDPVNCPIKYDTSPSTEPTSVTGATILP